MSCKDVQHEAVADHADEYDDRQAERAVVREYQVDDRREVRVVVEVVASVVTAPPARRVTTQYTKCAHYFHSSRELVVEARGRVGRRSGGGLRKSSP